MTSSLSPIHLSAKAQDLHGHLPKICTALAGPAMFERARQMSAEFSFFEFRLDTLEHPDRAIAELGELLRDNPGLIAIATCRRRENGGHFQGSAEQEAEVLMQASQAGAGIIDLSVESAEDLESAGSASLQALREGSAALLVSWHDFQGTPDLEAVYTRMQRFAPDFYKIVPTARTLRDSLQLLNLLQRRGDDGNLIAMSMGMPGVPTRILGPRYGSRFTFGSSDQGSETAPGQVGSRSLRDLYRLSAITAKTKVHGVFGKPVGGSRSPVMLNTAFRSTGQDAVYLPLETDNADELFACVDGLQLAGASVTMPLKEQIVPRLTHLSDVARRFGTANTLVRRDGSMHGENTDVAGILGPLESRLALQGSQVLVLGAGGAARAAVHALRSQGAEVSIWNRTHAKAEELARTTGSVALTAAELAERRFDVILNATPYGMAHQQIEPPIQESQMNCRFFFDMVYNPAETPLIRMARARGAEILYGLEMFVTQGAAQYELWTNRPAPVDVMREAVAKSLQPAS